METSLAVPDNKEVGEAKLFKNSIFPADFQKALVEEIRNKALTALSEIRLDSPYERKPKIINPLKKNKQTPNRFHLATATRSYEGASNVPFVLTVNPFLYDTGNWHKMGPVDITLASALSYIEQENVTLLYSRNSTEEVCRILHVDYPQAYAQGLSILAGHLGHGRDRYPDLATSDYIETVLSNSRLWLLGERQKAQKYCKDIQTGIYGKSSSTSGTVKLTEEIDRLKGFDQGRLLLQEILQFNWNI